MLSALANRAVSGLPLSIGTSLGLESLLRSRLPPYDPARVPPDPIDMKKYNVIWINLLTLYRNIIGAVPSESRGNLFADDLSECLLIEMSTIEEIVREDSSGTMKVVFYYNDYRDLIRQFNGHKAVTFRAPSTPAQLHAHDMLMRTMKVVTGERNTVVMTHDELKPFEGYRRALVMSHYPYDLLSYENFDSLHLLESHTGVLKTRKDWSSKYHAVGQEDLSILPFTRKLLLIFGDGYLIKPMDIRFRKLILEIARKRSWTPLTTEQKIKFYMDLDLKERYLYELYTKL